MMRALRGAGVAFVRRYHRLDVDGESTVPDRPAILVANHGFGGVFDLNVLAISAALDALRVDRPVTVMTHQIAWTLKVGKLVEAFGGRPASRGAALDALRRGHHVLVFPGGEYDAFKPFGDRHAVVFGGRTGFARLAHEAQVPIVPIVTCGAGESLLVLSDGRRLARLLRLDSSVRVKALPVSVSVPWGLNVGAVGLLPYLPLPAKLSTRVLAPMEARDGETTDQLAARVVEEMQGALDDMASRRRPWSR